jgi:hypothetical protein
VMSANVWVTSPDPRAGALGAAAPSAEELLVRCPVPRCVRHERRGGGRFRPAGGTVACHRFLRVLPISRSRLPRPATAASAKLKLRVLASGPPGGIII